MSTSQVTASGGFRDNRYFQLVIAICMMISIACLQYAWNVHAGPLKDKLGVELSVIQYSFTIFVMFQSFIQPGGGFIVDKFGPKWTILAGLMVGGGWAMMGNTTSISSLYFWYAVAGAGAGIIYGTCTGMSNKWFPDKKGMAAGLIAAGYGGGALPFIPAIRSMIDSSGIGSTMQTFGFIFAIVIIIGGLLLKFPASFSAQKGKKRVVRPEDFTPGEMMKTAHFWVLYAIFTSVNLGGLLITANSVAYGKAIGIAAAAVTLTASMQVAANASARAGWGWISDKLGRPRTMALSFGLNAVCLVLYPFVGTTNTGFIVMTTLIIFTWGSAFCLFPPACGDLFGAGYTSANYGFLYSAKGLASVFGGGVGAAIAKSMGWNVSFFIAAATSALAAILAIAVLPKLGKPTNKRMETNVQVSEKEIHA